MQILIEWPPWSPGYHQGQFNGLHPPCQSISIYDLSINKIDELCSHRYKGLTNSLTQGGKHILARKINLSDSGKS